MQFHFLEAYACKKCGCADLSIRQEYDNEGITITYLCSKCKNIVLRHCIGVEDTLSYQCGCDGAML